LFEKRRLKKKTKQNTTQNVHLYGKKILYDKIREIVITKNEKKNAHKNIKNIICKK